jgi:hypothetical protein
MNEAEYGVLAKSSTECIEEIALFLGMPEMEDFLDLSEF